MKRTILLLSLLLVMALLCVACVKTSDDISGTSERVAGAYEGVLRVGVDDAFPPFTYQNDVGEYAGFDIELARATCARMNYSLVIVPIDWDRKFKMLDDGEIDCVWSAFTIEGREELCAFTPAYLSIGECYLVKQESDIMTAEDLAGKSLAVQTGTSAQEALREEPEIMQNLSCIYELDGNESVITYVSYNAADAALVDVGTATYHCMLHPDKYRILKEHVKDNSVGVGLRKDNTELRDKIAEALDALRQDGTMEHLARKWSLESYLVEE
ncbi:MAG: transporter substrate-binding domain-containing protein [Lachnospiraceae bacterium]|nr:transporter substrate-binding domain-containing protein [Lachnospiraceae bacterium]